MSHPDDLALPADAKAIDVLTDAAAPEKAQEWRELRQRYEITLHVLADRKGVTLRARRRRIEFDNKTMTWLWLLGFGGWRAFRLHGPHLFWRSLTGGAIDGELRKADLTYAEAEGDLGAVLYAVRDFADLDTVDADGFWPQGVPRPQVDKNGLNVEQQAAFDLIMIATAYMLLHEVRHVMFNADGGRPSNPEEELACDAFACGFLLEGIGAYVTTPGEDAQTVLAKRAAGIALGAYALYKFTPERGRGRSDDYPPVADRLDALFPRVDLPEDHWFWDFAASLLVAVVVDRHRGAEMPPLAGVKLCHALVDVLRARYGA